MTRTRRPRCARCARRDNARDLRGCLTIIVVAAVFGLAFTQLLTGREEGATVPPWAAATLATTLTGYYMSRGAERMVAAIRRDAERREAGTL